MKTKLGLSALLSFFIVVVSCGRWINPSKGDSNLGLSSSGGQASMSLSAILGSITNKKITEWSLQKSASPVSIVKASSSPLSYFVTVTEGKTLHLVSETQTLTITNAGSVSSYLGSLILNLQTKSGGNQFNTFASGILDRANPARSSVPTCLGTYKPNSAFVSMQILDAATNDVISFNQAPEIPGGQTVTWILNVVIDADILTSMKPGLSLRNENLITFINAGSRGNSSDSVSCSIDADGNGAVDQARTVASRTSTYVPSISFVNSQVSLSDQIRQAIDASKVSVSDLSLTPAMSISSGNIGDPLSSSGLNSATSVISASYSFGKQSIFEADGNASCVLFDGSISSLINEASLSSDDSSHIFGSPARAQVDISCPVPETQAVELKIKAGDFVTYTQGGWGSKCPPSQPSGQPGCIRDSKFALSFPTGLKMGDLSGQAGSSNGFTASWSTSAAIKNFLPQGGTSCQLTVDMSNPTSSSAGVLGGQLVAAKLNVGFDLSSSTATVHKFCHSDGSPIFLRDLIYKNSSNSNDGLTVSQIVSKGDDIVKGPGVKDLSGKCVVPSDGSASSINEALDNINQNFDNGTTLGSNLILPSDSKSCSP